MKKYLVLLLTLCMVFSLCTIGAAAASADGEKQQIIVAFNDASDTGEDGFTYKWVKNVADKWNNDQYEIVIQDEPVSDSDFTTKMHLQLSDASTAPDIVLYDGFQLQSDISAGYFIALDELAAEFYLSKQYISKYIKDKSGMTFCDNVQKVRMKKAEELLTSTSYNIEKVAELSGYPSVEHFNRRFKKLHELTPVQFRNRNKK